MRVLVTGAHGYLGSAIFHAFAEVKRTALVSPWGDTSLIANAIANGADVVRADIREPGDLASLLAGHDVVVHAAARALDYGPWRAFERVNVHGTQNLAEAAKRAGVRRFVYISTVAVHRYSGFVNANPATQPRDEDRYAYARSKKQAEDILHALAADHFEVVILRPGLWPHGGHDPSLTRMIPALKTGFFPLVGGGNAHLNVVSARTFAHATRQAAMLPHVTHGTFVVADAGMPTWREVLAVIASEIGAPPPRVALPEWLVLPVARELEYLWAFVARDREPPLTQYRARLMSRSAHFDPALAAAALQYELQPWDAELRLSVREVLA